MSEIKRTAAQEKAVSSRGRNLMISAGAGSGKTRTLTERIIDLICDPVSPANVSDMLVVTFTKKAAGELRARITSAIAKALEANPGNAFLTNQLTSVGGAQICTIDSYYLSLVREHFQQLGLPASFRMADPAESKILARSVAEDVIENKFRTDPDFPHLADTLTSAKGEQALAEIIISFSEKVRGLPGGVNALFESAAAYEAEASQDYFLSRTGKITFSALSDFVKKAAENAAEDLDFVNSEPKLKNYREAVESDKTQIDALLALIERKAGYAEIRSAIQNFQILGLKSCGKFESKERDLIKAHHKEIHDKFKDDLKIRAFALTEEAVALSLKETASVLKTLAGVIRDFDAAFIEAKSRNLIADFSDLSRHTLALLEDSDGKPTETALAERKRFSHVFVDEYQDTDFLQDRIFKLITNGTNLFIVGDVKQSIYAFRGAQPDVFSAYRGLWTDIDKAAPGEPAAIYMSENFRCSKAVIDFTNTVCRKLFSEAEAQKVPGGGIGYRTEDDLIYAGESPSVAPVGVYLCCGAEKPKDKTEEELPKNETNGSATEIRAIVKKIRECAERRGTPLNPAWGDVAVLALKWDPLSDLASALAAEGIPFVNNGKSDLFQNPEVLLFYSLLCAVDNPLHDVHLAGALRSPIFAFSLTDLADCRQETPGVTLWEALSAYPASENAEEGLAAKCKNAKETLEEYRRLAADLPIDRFIRLIWKRTCAPGFSGSDKATVRQSPGERRSNLRGFYEFARSNKSSGFHTLHDFVSYVAGLLESDAKLEIEPGPAENAVNLMTVHKSKGLEFPVVILANTSGEFNQMDERSASVFTRVAGIGFASKITDRTGMCTQNTPMRCVVSDILSQLNKQEKIRELYVALTRAREELYVFAHGKDSFADKLFTEADKYFRTGGTLMGDDTWISWIVKALSGLDSNKPDGFFRFFVATPDSAKEDEKSLKESAATSPETEKTDEKGTAAEDEAYAKIKAALEYSYPYDFVSKIPAKLSVSRLYPDVLTDAEADGTAAVLEEDREYVPSFAGGSSAGAAERGTATHLFLQFCDFSNLDGTRATTDAEIERLVDLKFIPKRSAELIRRGEIDRFAKSVFAKLLAAAKIQYREQRFNVLLPASQFTTDSGLAKQLSDEKVLVQGVIDLLLESSDGKLVLCDYKTDRIPQEIIGNHDAVVEFMRERHALQLSYYADAIERIFGRRPDSILIFPLAYGEAVEI